MMFVSSINFRCLHKKFSCLPPFAEILKTYLWSSFNLGLTSFSIIVWKLKRNM